MQSISPSSASVQFAYPASATAAAAATSYFPVSFHLQTAQYPTSTWHTATPAPAPVYNAVYPMPQIQQVMTIVDSVMGEDIEDVQFRGLGFGPVFSETQPEAQQLFQKDSQIITPEALATVKAAIAGSNDKDKKVESKKKAVPRKAAGQCWEDPTLAEWPESERGCDV